jgi:hypothetical protein
MKIFAKTLAAAALLSATCLPALSCDVGALRTNVEWLRTNNPGAFSAIRNACGRVSDNASLNALISAYKDGQRHNPSAQAAIDGCTVQQIGNGAC